MVGWPDLPRRVEVVYRGSEGVKGLSYSCAAAEQWGVSASDVLEAVAFACRELHDFRLQPALCCVAGRGLFKGRGGGRAGLVIGGDPGGGAGVGGIAGGVAEEGAEELVVGVEGGGVGVEEGVDVEGEFLLVKLAWEGIGVSYCVSRRAIRLAWNVVVACTYLV